MTETQEIITLLEEKTDLLLELEQISDSLYSLPIEEVPQSMNKRQALVNKMEKLDARIELLCSGLSPIISEAVKTHGDRDALSGESRTIFDKAMELKRIARRVSRNADGIREIIEMEQQRTQVEIQKMYSSSGRIAGRYGQAVRTGSNKRIGSNKNWSTQI